MDRRRFLAGSAGLVSLLAGCTGESGESTPTPTETPTTGETPSTGVELPDGVYVQPFDGSMSMQGVAEAGPYEVALMYAAPHRFWLVEGDRIRERPIRPADDIHLMAAVWDAETSVVVPETGLSVEVRQDGESVSEEVVYPMLSQQMGFHYGGNFILDGDGEYEVEMTVGGLPIRASGAFDGRFEEPATATFELSFTEEERQAVEVEENDDHGELGSVAPMEMGMLPSPLSASEVLGDVLGGEMTHDAEVVPTVLEADSPVGERYLAVYLRTRYNELAITAAELSATVERDDELVADLNLRRTLDSEAGYHYGAELETDLQAGDELTVDVVTIPQVARHEGYERAFLEIESVTFTV